MQASLHLNCFGVPSRRNNPAIRAFNNNLRERNAATQLDDAAVTRDLFANFCSGNVADAHFKRNTGFQRVGADNGHRANYVDYGGDASAMKRPVTALSV